LPIYRLDGDAVRRELDDKFGTSVLGLPAALFAEGGPIDLLRRKLAAEPSVRGKPSIRRRCGLGVDRLRRAASRGSRGAPW